MFNSSNICNSHRMKTQMSTNSWRNKMWYTHVIEYYSTIKKE